METPPKIPSGYAGRTLRIIMIAAFIPALAFLTTCGFMYMIVPTIGLIPMAFSLVINIIALRNPKSPIRRKPMADAIVTLSLLAVMSYSWDCLLRDWRLNADAAMLCAYGISPMIVNFCLHSYIALRAILPSPFEPTPCPNCNHTPNSIIPRWQQERHVTLPADDDNSYGTMGPQAQIVSAGGPGTSRGVKQIYQPPFTSRGGGDEDANVRESSEFQTSGFNTPRQSAETLRSDVRVSSEDSGETVRRDGKGGSLV